MAAPFAWSGKERGLQRKIPYHRSTERRCPPARVHNAEMTHDQSPAFTPLGGNFEPSAILQLPDGRFVVAEDEKSHPLSLVTIGMDGSDDSAALSAGLLQIFGEFWKLDDIEGLVPDSAGFVYRIT